jgi:hypothetical protein
MSRLLGVGVVGIGWVAMEHLRAFGRNPHVRVTRLCDLDEGRARAKLAAAGVDVGQARFTRRYQDLLDADDVDIVSIATPNHLHAEPGGPAAGAASTSSSRSRPGWMSPSFAASATPSAAPECARSSRSSFATIRT